MDFLKDIVDAITSIFDFFSGIIESINDFIEQVNTWWDVFLTVLEAFPPSLVAIVVGGFGLLIAFIVIELLRDFL